jgi:toxin-antitoxin system PIN domain toxin
MLIPDVNVLLNAFRTDADDHKAASDWLLSAGNGDQPVGVPLMILLGFARVATTSIRDVQSMTPETAFARCGELFAMPSYTPLAEGPGHWRLFTELVGRTGISGSRFTDAYLAAFAIENDATFVTFDRGFARFPGLRVALLA